MTIICKQNIFMTDHLASKAINGDILVSVSDKRRETLIFTLHNAPVFSLLWLQGGQAGHNPLEISKCIVHKHNRYICLG